MKIGTCRNLDTRDLNIRIVRFENILNVSEIVVRFVQLVANSPVQFLNDWNNRMCVHALVHNIVAVCRNYDDIPQT